ncbi:MAG: molybdopterin-dependent oxidoreductase, partial [Chloroflexota bacterium]|nr:molybdopterin-dependent oxidoreductase [Chloroflexota bacterium]
GVVPAFPETVLAAIARLTPLSVFGAATENYGGLAKKATFVAVLVGIAAVGYGAGVLAGRLSRRTGPGLAGRLLAAGTVAGGLLLFALLVVLPIANLGAFASKSTHTVALLTQFLVTFALFGITWALFADPVPGLVPAHATAGGAANVSRRRVVGRGAWGMATLAALAGVGGMTWRLLTPRAAPEAVDASREAAQRIADAAGRAAPAPAAPAPVAPTSAAVPAPPGAASAALAPPPPFEQLEANGELTPVLTSVADFYHVSKNVSDPTVSADGWALEVTGLVDREIRLTHADLLARATDQKITTLCCISNELNGDLIGTAQWSGFPLATLLAEAGVQPGAVDLKFHCSDDYEDSIPVAQGMDPDTLVVVGMNGDLLTPDHGFPARMIVPGIYGMKNVKWLERIEVVDEDFKGYWQTRGWSDPAPNQIWGRIDTPASGQKLEPGPAVAAGVASAGDRGISRVEVSLDDGETWADATLEPALNAPFTWVRWAFPFEAVPGKHKLVIRPTDGTGQVAEEKRRNPLPEGATGWPSRRVQVNG